MNSFRKHVYLTFYDSITCIWILSFSSWLTPFVGTCTLVIPFTGIRIIKITIITENVNKYKNYDLYYKIWFYDISQMEISQMEILQMDISPYDFSQILQTETKIKLYKRHAKWLPSLLFYSISAVLSVIIGQNKFRRLLKF